MKKLRIGGHTYSIKEDPDLPKNQWGLFEAEKLLIRIAPSLHDDVKTMTLLHEMLHGLFWEYNIQVKNEETVVSSLTTAFAQFIKNNPEFIKAVQSIN